MSKKRSKIYEFADFQLVPTEGLLLRNGEPVPLAPKAFSTLLMLIENNGHLVEKTELIERVWADAFVEEAAVSRCIWTIRTALGVDSNGQRYIQTVPKRGYRFVAEVNEFDGEEPGAKSISDETAAIQYSAVRLLSDARPANTTSGANDVVSKPPGGLSVAFDDQTGKLEYTPPKPVNTGLVSRNNRRFATFVIAALLAVGGIVTAAFLGISSGQYDTPIVSRSLSVERLSNDGGALHAVISPDGKQIFYARELGDLQSIRLRDVETGNDTEVISSAQTHYFGLTIAPDGRTLYFVRRSEGNQRSDLFRVPVTGGIPQKIAENVQGWTGISSDGDRISYVRCLRLQEDYCSLFIADTTNGGNERKLITRAAPVRIGDSIFTPDGADVIFANGQSLTGANEFILSKVNIVTGEELNLSSERFFDIKNIEWLKGSRSLLMTAARGRSDRSGFWKVDSDTWQAVPLGGFSGNFNNVSLDQAATILVATEVTPDFRLRVHGLGETSETITLAHGGASDFTPDGKIVFGSNISGQLDIWMSDPDGRGLRQLTNAPSEERTVIAGHDGRSLFYSSNRSGDLQVWKMNLDGSEPIRITTKTGGYPTSVSVDGRWVFFESHIDNTIWQVSTDGSVVERPITKISSWPVSISPDGSTLAYTETVGQSSHVFLTRTDGNARVRSFDPVPLGGRIESLKWSADGRAIYYLLRGPADGTSSIYKQLKEGGSAIRLHEIQVGNVIAVHSFAVSRNERLAIVSSGEWKHDLVLINGIKQKER